jgi:cytochrome c oxidase subunit I+III
VLVAIVRGVRSGPPAGDDPWGGDTLEWRTSSPPPPYNFAAVPVVRSAHPAWDDAAGLDVLPGHRALETSSLRADDAEPLPMPHESWWPLALAGLLGAVAVCALLELWVVAAVLVVAAFGAVGGWHLREAHPGVRVTGRLGMIGLLATEATLLLCLVSADLYLRLRADAGPWPPAGTPAPKLTLALVLTGLIAVTTTLALLGSRLGRPAVLGALVTAVAACVVQGFELANAVGDAHPADSAYGAMFAILAGAHAAHLVAGVPLLAWIAVRPRLAWLAGAYWSFLSLLWIVVLATLYLSVR